MFNKTFGGYLPTRTGLSAGGAAERQMLDAVGEIGFHKRFVTNLDGSVTMLTTKNGMAQFSTSSISNSAQICPNYLSGVMLYGWNAAHPPFNAIDTLYFYPSVAYAAGGSRSARALSPSYPEMKTETHGADWTKFKLAWLTPLRTPVNLTPPAPYTFYTDVPQAAFIRPGMYSGSMRAVIQYMLGAQTPIKFGYHFGATHGIANIPSETGTVPWVIEISAAFGVLACRLQLCSKPDSFSPLGYTPLGADLPCTSANLQKLLDTGKVIRLLTVAQMAEFYAYAAIFPECGWAFSYTGMQAQNTGVGKDGIYQTCQRFKITFSHSAGMPSEASISKVDGGFMINNPGTVYARSQVRIPNYGLQGCVTMNMKPDVTGAHSVDSICPIYVYYDGDNEQVVTWWNETLVGDPTLSLPAWSTFNCENQSMYGQRYVTAPSINGAKSRYYQIKSPLWPTPDFFTRDGTWQIKTPILHNGWQPYFAYPPNSPSGPAQTYVYTVYSVKTETVNGAGTGSRHTLTIPLYEREMIYHMRETQDFDNGNTTFYEHYTVLHRDAISKNYFIGKEWDPAQGNYVEPYKWKFSSNYGPIGGSGIGVPFEGALSPLMPIALHGTNFEAAPGYLGPTAGQFPWVAPVLNLSPVIIAPTERATNSTLHVVGSRFSPSSLGFNPAAQYSSDQWLKVLPDEIGWSSKMWVSRSANGMYVVPNKERQTNMTPTGDFILKLGSYPDTLAFNAPWLVFLGSAEDKPTANISPPDYR